jgi:hypothetical protein
MRNKEISKTVIKNHEYFSKSIKGKTRQRKSKMLQYKEKIGEKLRNEYNIKKPEKKLNHATSSSAAALVYGERMFMDKYKNNPKFLQNLNSTYSPRKNADELSPKIGTSKGYMIKRGGTQVKSK